MLSLCLNLACNVPTGRAIAGNPRKVSGKYLRGGWYFPILYVFRPVSAYRQAEVDVAAAIRQRELIRVRELLLFGFLRSHLLRHASSCLPFPSNPNRPLIRRTFLIPVFNCSCNIFQLKFFATVNINFHKL